MHRSSDSSGSASSRPPGRRLEYRDIIPPEDLNFRAFSGQSHRLPLDEPPIPADAANEPPIPADAVEEPPIPVEDDVSWCEEIVDDNFNPPDDDLDEDDDVPMTRLMTRQEFSEHWEAMRTMIGAWSLRFRPLGQECHKLLEDFDHVIFELTKIISWIEFLPDDLLR